MQEKYMDTIDQLTKEMIENLPDAFSNVRKFRPCTTPEEFMEDIFRSLQTRLDHMKELMCDDYYDGEE